MDIIKLLPDSVANQIAAGEVIQRPASVVKELVENSIDAGATNVQIIIKDAGRTLIQVIDNGVGMSTTDARMAFERHATSKIRQATDLFSLHTMGFRGEALPSVAAVSEIEMRTMRHDDTTGTRLVIVASQVESQQPDVCMPGTNMMVKRLFFNVPARRKFLKKDSIELGHILREFERLALVNTGVQLSIAHNGVTLHTLLAATLKQRITDLFGKNLERQLLEISTDTSLVKIDGFVSTPEHARRRGALQYFFVNGRNMRHPYFHRAVIECYDRLIAADMQPNYFINLTVDPDTIDVNIHPQKHEIKFENEAPIRQILVAAIKQSLGRVHAMGAFDFEAVDSPEIPAYNPADIPADIPAYGDDNYNPFDIPSQADATERVASTINSHSHNGCGDQQSHRSSISTDWQKLYDGFLSGQDSADLPPTPPPAMSDGNGVMASSINSQSHLFTDTPGSNTPAAPMAMQLRGRYLVTPTRNGLMIIDQHRAHILVLYSKFMDSVQQGPVPTQRLIFPESLTLDAADNVVMMSIGPLLSSMGFDLADLGNNSWAINGVPSLLGKTNASDALSQIINAVGHEEGDMQLNQWQTVALSMARSAAIRYGTTLTHTEIDTLIADLLKLPAPDYTPDGNRIITVITDSEIAARL